MSRVGGGAGAGGLVGTEGWRLGFGDTATWWPRLGMSVRTEFHICSGAGPAAEPVQGIRGVERTCE